MQPKAGWNTFSAVLHLICSFKGDVPPHLGQPCYVALGFSLDMGLISLSNHIFVISATNSSENVQKQGQMRFQLAFLGVQQANAGGNIQ